MRSLLLLAFLVLSVASCVAAGVGCLDESGNRVDWWVILKAPKLEKHSDRSAASGMGYSYGDSKNGAMRWTGNRLDTDKNKALGSTLNQIYSRSSQGAYLIYNDQPIYADDPPSTYAHAKGVVSWDKDGGFWLVHSVPNFPPPAGRAYDMPDSAYTNGQSFLCISLTPSGLDQVGAALLIDRPYVYSKNIPKSLSSVSANLQSVFDGNYVKDPTAQSFSIRTAGGDPFVIFAKNRQWHSDLYSKYVVSTLKTSIYTETWMNGPASNKLPTLCSGSNPYAVINVDEVSLSSTIKWDNSEDHSKWAISADSKKPIFCIGDINRQKSQANRGGGTVCGTDSKVWNSFKSFITKSDTCKGYNS